MTNIIMLYVFYSIFLINLLFWSVITISTIIVNRKNIWAILRGLLSLVFNILFLYAANGLTAESYTSVLIMAILILSVDLTGVFNLMFLD